MKVYLTVRNQVITAGMGGDVLDLHFPSVKMVMDLFGVMDQKSCFDKVLFMFHDWLKDYKLKVAYERSATKSRKR